MGMAYNNGGAYPGSNAIAIIPDATGPPDSWNPGGNDQPAWGANDDYGAWSGDPSSDMVSNASYDGRQSQSRAGSEQPPNKKSRNPQGDSQGNKNTTSKAIGKMFFKTKLCCKFRAGTCPYITNCNFAHGIEELRKPPPNLQEIVAAHEEGSEIPREEHQIPTISSSIVVGESDRSYKARRCKKFYTDEGCPYGDSCTFLHDEQSKARESVAISLSPTVEAGGFAVAVAVNGSSQKPSNWKTRICNKWEMTGYCPFGAKCHFAHGTAEMHRYGGGSMDTEGRDVSSAIQESKQTGASTKTPPEIVVALNSSVHHADMYHIGASSQRSSGIFQRQGQRLIDKWKGPDKISRNYGDWIDEIE